MIEPISTNDIAAFDDVLGDLEGEADDMGLQRALDMHDTLEATRLKLKATMGSIYTRILNLTKEPVRVDGGVAVSKPTGKWRPLKANIREAVVMRSAYDTNGELIANPRAAAERAIELMWAMYVSPSTIPKSGALEQMKLEKKDVMKWQQTGNELVIKTIDEVDDDA